MNPFRGPEQLSQVLPNESRSRLWLGRFALATVTAVVLVVILYAFSAFFRP